MCAKIRDIATPIKPNFGNKNNKEATLITAEIKYKIVVMYVFLSWYKERLIVVWKVVKIYPIDKKGINLIAG